MWGVIVNDAIIAICRSFFIKSDNIILVNILNMLEKDYLPKNLFSACVF